MNHWHQNIQICIHLFFHVLSVSTQNFIKVYLSITTNFN